jgi:uncharacterized membrane protein
MAATFESFKHHWPQPLNFRAAGLRPLSRRFVWTLRLICCVALGVTGYLAVTALRAGEVAGCGGGAVWDCGFALHSRWAKVLGVPVSIPAFVLYAVVLGALAFCRPGALRSRVTLAWGVVTLGALSAGLAALWFVGLQVFAVGHLCEYCLAAHSCGLLLCGAVLWQRPLGSRITGQLAGLGAAGVGMLIAIQVFSAPPPTYTVEHYEPWPTESAAAPVTTGSASNSKTKSRAPEVFEPPTDAPDDPAEK